MLLALAYLLVAQLSSTPVLTLSSYGSIDAADKVTLRWTPTQDTAGYVLCIGFTDIDCVKQILVPWWETKVIYRSPFRGRVYFRVYAQFWPAAGQTTGLSVSNTVSTTF
jgi:hypothetical protein